MKKTDFIILILLSIFVFADTIRVPFMWDDEGQIERDASIRNPDMFVFLKPSYWKRYRTTISPVEVPLKPVSPMRTLSYMLDYKLWGLNPAGFHLTNIILHIFNVMLVYLLCWTIFRDRKISLLAGLFFAVHPMHVETVAWIKNRIDLFCSLFFLSSLILFVKYAEQTRNFNTKLTRNLSIVYRLSSIVCFILALLSKEMAVTLPAILVLYIVCFKSETLGKGLASQPVDRKTRFFVSLRMTIGEIVGMTFTALKKTIPYWIITAIYFYFQFFYVKAGELAGQMAGTITLYSHILIVLKTIAYYLKLLLLPFWFCVERFISKSGSLFEPMVLISLAVIVSYFFTSYLLYKKQKGLFFSLVFILITILPVSNVIYLASRPIAEHRLYIPSIGFCLLLGKLFADGISGNLTGFTGLSQNLVNPVKKILLILSKFVFLILILGYSFASMKRNHDWLSPISLWEATVKTSPSNFRTHYNLGGAYLVMGRDEDALVQFEKALEITPDDPLLYNSLGVIHFSHDRLKEAMTAFENAIKVYPKFDNAHSNLGWAYYKLGKKEEALKHIKKAIEINSDFGLPHLQLGEIYEDERKIDEAIREYRTACEIQLYDWQFHNKLITILEKEKKFDEAIVEYKRAIEINPYSVDVRNNLGIVYVQKKMYKEAEEEFKKVLVIDSANSTGLENLATIEKILSKLGKNKK